MSNYAKVFREYYVLMEKSFVEAVNALNKKSGLCESEFEKELAGLLKDEILQTRGAYKEAFTKCFLYLEKYKGLLESEGIWEAVVNEFNMFRGRPQNYMVCAVYNEFERIYHEHQKQISGGGKKTNAV